MKNSLGNCVRYNLRVSADVKKYFEEESERTGLSQNSLMMMALSEYVNQKLAFKNVQLLNEVLAQVNSLKEESRSKE